MEEEARVRQPQFLPPTQQPDLAKEAHKPPSLLLSSSKQALVLGPSEPWALPTPSPRWRGGSALHHKHV